MDATLSVLMTPAVFIPYSACALLIVIYAWGRFNTPPSNRSSTRQALYWWSGFGYVASALMLFAGLCFLLQAGEWRSALLGPADNAALPASLIAHNRFASVDKIARVPLPKLFVHAREDADIPIAHGRRLFELASAPKQFQEVAGGHANAYKVDPAFFTAVGRFLSGPVSYTHLTLPTILRV